MDWNDFAKRLTLELSRLPVTSFLIVQGPSGLPYTQAMRAEGVLDAEAVSSAFLPRPLAPRQERRLRSLGWEPPDDEERKNWWHQLTLRERGGRVSAENLEACALVAGLMVGAFRDVYRIESPLELVYQASRTGPEGGPLALPGLGIPLAVPESEGRSASARAPRPSGSALENALAEARERGDQRGYLELLARATLYLPSPGDPGSAGHRFATAQFGDGTYVLAFTSPEAMDLSLQGQAVHHRQASLAELSRRWPHPEWQLAINPGLPSASYLDAKALLEPEEPRRSAGRKAPEPTDVHVAGASTRGRARGAKPARGGSATGRRGSGAPERPAPPRGGTPAPSRASAAQQTPARSPGDVPARPASPSPSSAPVPSPAPAPSQAAPPQPRPEAPGARQAPPRQAPPAPETPAHGAPARETPPTRETRPARETVGDPRGVPAQRRGGAPTPASARETPSDPHGLPVMPANGRREAAATAPGPHPAPVSPPQASAPTTQRPSTPVPPPAQQQAAPTAPQRSVPGDEPTPSPGARSTGRQGQRTQDAPVAGRRPAGTGDKRDGKSSQVVVMQKVLRPEHVHHYLEGGYDLVAGYVHRFQDVRELTTPASVIRCLGLVYEGSPFSSKTEELYVIRWPAVKPSLFRRPLGGIDEWSMGIIPGGWVIEKAPFPGSGYAPGEGPAIPEFKIESQRLPHGAELYRIAADGRETLVAGYDADLRRWTVRLPGAAGGRA